MQQILETAPDICLTGEFSRISIKQIRQEIFIIKNKKVGEAVVELDQFKSILATYTEPLVEVRDSL